MLVSSHILSEMAEFCTSVGIMERGKMVVSGGVDEVALRVTGAKRLAIEVLDGLETCLRILEAEEAVADTLALVLPVADLSPTGRVSAPANIPKGKLTARLIRATCKTTGSSGRTRAAKTGRIMPTTGRKTGRIS